jgi:hypothetical protein
MKLMGVTENLDLTPLRATEPAKARELRKPDP